MEHFVMLTQPHAKIYQKLGNHIEAFWNHLLTKRCTETRLYCQFQIISRKSIIESNVSIYSRAFNSNRGLNRIWTLRICAKLETDVCCLSWLCSVLLTYFGRYRVEQSNWSMSILVSHESNQIKSNQMIVIMIMIMILSKIIVSIVLTDSH
jgi:hypothetical protein